MWPTYLGNFQGVLVVRFRWVSLILVALLVVLVDVGLKSWAATTLHHQPPMYFLGDILQLSYREQGAVFLGLGAAWPSVFQWGAGLLFPSLVIFTAMHALFSGYGGGVSWLGFALLCGGMAAGFCDRLVDGAVVDIFWVRFGDLGVLVLNFADIAAACGLMIILLCEALGVDIEAYYDERYGG